jgi:hypothetical protein
MSKNTMFGYLALDNNFSTSPENLATEALCYILEKSHVTRELFLKYLGMFSFMPKTSLYYKSQVDDIDKIPDLVGYTQSGEKVLIIENKFWAGLTSNQPKNYLFSISEDKEGLLLFIAPSLRTVTLFNELKRKLRIEGISDLETILDKNEEKAVRVNGSRIMAITSWRSVLSYLLHGVELEHDHDCASDIQQLMGLCERMDEEAFIPFTSVDLSSSLGKVIKQLIQKINETRDKLQECNKNIKIGGLTNANGPGWYGRYFFLSGYGTLLFYSSDNWANLAETPLWLRIQNASFQPSDQVFNLFSAFYTMEPPGAYRLDNGLNIPLFLKTGVDKEEVISDLVFQISKIGNLLETKPERLIK